MMLGRQNEFHWLGTLGAQRERLWTRSVRLAKAKVAGSNPLFRSKWPGFRVLSGSGLFHGRCLTRRRRRLTSVPAEQLRVREQITRVGAVHVWPRFALLEQGWNIRGSPPPPDRSCP